MHFQAASEEERFRERVANALNVDRLRDGGLPALHFAAKNNWSATTKALLARGADVNLAECGMTALHVAAFWGNFEIAWLLLNAGARIDARARLEQTAIQFAAMRGNRNIVELLLGRGAAFTDDLVESAYDHTDTLLLLVDVYLAGSWQAYVLEQSPLGALRVEIVGEFPNDRITRSPGNLLNSLFKRIIFAVPDEVITQIFEFSQSLRSADDRNYELFGEHRDLPQEDY